MKALVIGSEGFIGRNVYAALSESNDNQVVGTTRKQDIENAQYLDLAQPGTIVEALKKTQPDVIINCAGIVDNSDKAVQNVTFTTNLLEAIVASGLQPRQTIIVGSAGEYGEVNEEDIPADEDTPLRAKAGYGLSKRQESTFAQAFGREHHLPVVVARVFNPLGVGMPSKLLIPRIMQQIQELKGGARDAIEISRLDACRDYIDIWDVAAAIKRIAENEPKQSVYNIGSGRSTSNGELLDLILDSEHLPTKPTIVQTSETPEPVLAHQADITRIEQDYSWEPVVPLEETIERIVHASE